MRVVYFTFGHFCLIKEELFWSQKNSIVQPFWSWRNPGIGLSMLNNNVLSYSDFLSGAFPADYGNSFFGAFDFFRHVVNNNG